MTDLIAALPMYDWPEVRAEVDAQWAAIRDRLRAAGVAAPEVLTRRNADLPPVQRGIRDRDGQVIAPDPATLPPDEFDLPTLWRHPNLLFGQTCWGPMETTDLARHVRVIGQPSYDGFEGGEGEFYSSAVVMRRQHARPAGDVDARVPAPREGRAVLPLDLMRGKRLAFSEPHSMSGLLALARDLAAAGESLEMFSRRVETGGHRLSIVAVAEGRADVATIDCRSWSLARRFEPAASGLEAVGWTARRKGLPFIASRHLPEATAAALRGVLSA